MIIDWVKNSKEIQKTKRLRVEEPCDRKVSFKQEIVYVQYLLDVCGYDRDQCFKAWKQIKNGTAAKFKGDPEAQKIEFLIIWRKIGNDQFRKPHYTKSVEPIVIFEEEIEFLNNLDTPLWMKQYWGALLFYYKFAVQIYERVFKTSALNAWCIYHSSYKKKNYGGNCQDRLASKLIELKAEHIEVIRDLPVQKVSESSPTYLPMFLVERGRNPRVFTDVNQIDSFLSMLSVAKSTCPQCGAPIQLSSYKKTTLCPQCYKSYRREQWRKAQRKARSGDI